VIILIVVFNVFFPSFSYKNRWEEALILLKTRDLILTIDRTGKLFSYSFSSSALQNFLDTLVPISETGMLSWSETEGTIKNEIVLACNCTADQMRTLSLWTKDLKINGRNVTITTVYTNLHDIQSSDVLLIWGEKDLSNYVNELKEYLKNGNGIVEIADFRTADEVNSAQQQIVGLSFIQRIQDVADYNSFSREPDNSTDAIYEPYKYFLHIPVPLNAEPSTLSIPGCSYSTSNKGNFTFRKTSYSFWICSGTSVWFDADANGQYDMSVSVGQNFKLGGYDFTLNYIDDNRKIGISFNQTFRFSDFLYIVDPPKGSTHLEPADGNSKKVLVNAVFSSPPANFPVVILNSTQVNRAAWIADFTDDAVGDDHKLLLISLVLWASNKKASAVLSSNLKIGYITSYINVNNTDMFEVYKFNLGLGYPYY